MAHYAKVSAGKVTKVIVADQDFIDSIKIDNEPGEWVQTSYNTYGGVHKLGGTPLRKNYAGPSMIYDRDKDAFYEQQPYASWPLNSTTCLWEAPVAYPSDGKNYKWDESSTSWKEIT